MSAGIADRLDIVISVVAGLAVTLYGFGVIGRRPQGASDPRQQRFITLAKWLGPLLVVISAVRLLAPR